MKTLLNLYDEIRPRHVRYSMVQLSTTLIVVLVLLAGWGMYSSWSVNALSQERVALEGQEQTLTPQIEAMQSELADDDRLPALRQRIDRLTLELQGRERMQALIADLDSQNTAGFSPLLAALASASRNDAWLTRISMVGPRVGAAPERVHLHGMVLDAQALAHYLDALAQAPVLHGLPFATVIVGGPEHEQTTLPFELDSQVAESKP